MVAPLIIAGVPLAVKAVAIVGAGLVGGAVFSNFITEETLQAADYGVRIAIDSGDMVTVDKSRATFAGLLKMGDVWINGPGRAALIFNAPYQAFIVAEKGKLAAYDAVIAALRKSKFTLAEKKMLAALEKEDSVRQKAAQSAIARLDFPAAKAQVAAVKNVDKRASLEAKLAKAESQGPALAVQKALVQGSVSTAQQALALIADPTVRGKMELKIEQYRARAVKQFQREADARAKAEAKEKAQAEKEAERARLATAKAAAAGAKATADVRLLGRQATTEKNLLTLYNEAVQQGNLPAGKQFASEQELKQFLLDRLSTASANVSMQYARVVADRFKTQPFTAVSDVSRLVQPIVLILTRAENLSGPQFNYWLASGGIDELGGDVIAENALKRVGLDYRGG